MPMFLFKVQDAFKIKRCGAFACVVCCAADLVHRVRVGDALELRQEPQPAIRSQILEIGGFQGGHFDSARRSVGIILALDDPSAVVGREAWLVTDESR